MAEKRVVIIGGGFGGLNVAKNLKKSPYQISVIDKTNHHLFQPLLYQVASASLAPGEIAIPIREVLRHHKNTAVIMGDVISIDKDKQEVILKDRERFIYDYLVLSVGARHSYFGNSKWEQYAPGLKTIQDALSIRENILISFEKAERSHDRKEIQKYLTFIIIGGGPTGVEMAGAIAEIAHKTMTKNFRRIHPEQSKIYLVEALETILPMYPSKLAQKAEKDLIRLGVKVMKGKKVTQINSEGVQIAEAFYPCKNVIWAAGNAASPLIKSLDTPLDKQGRAIVEKDLSIPHYPNIFVIGDAAATIGKNNQYLPGVASVAIQQGKYISQILKKNLHQEKRPPFVYFDKGTMATIGKGKAIATTGRFQFSGMTAWLMWCFVHIVYLIGFRNRLSVIIQWFILYFTGQRGSRLIYNSIDSSKESITN